jgi:protein gp37
MRMFSIVDDIWNPVAMRCKHRCYPPRHCWATQLIEGKLKNSNRYRELGDDPILIEKELQRKFKRNTLVFVEDMGDLFGRWVPIEWIAKIMKVIKGYPQTEFLFLTKNPARYLSCEDGFSFNMIFGATIETNRSTALFSNAPDPYERYTAMRDLQVERDQKFISIEPIMDFDLDTFAPMIYGINPYATAIGYDNHNCNLPEPSLEKTMNLIARLEKFTKVYRKTLREKAG